MTQKERSRLIKKIDTAFSLRVRLRDQQCLVCGRRDTLQCAHIIPRTYHQTRWDFDNAITLCYKHHIYWAHKDPDAFITWLDNRSPDLRQSLRQKANLVSKIDLVELYASMKI